jgi:epoxyqueuosine reductase
MSLADAIKREARSLGFDAVGIAAVPPSHSSSSGLLDRLETWLRRGYHGTMSWMARDPQRRADPRWILKGCCSIVVAGMNYDTGHRAREGPGYGRIARYAWGQDYHCILGNRLKQLETCIHSLAPAARTRSYVDTGPVMEKYWAQQAGLGWLGKHSNLVSPEHGSWLVLGEILTTLELSPDSPGADLCGSCSLCIQACPTGAIVEPYVVDANRCVSYLTIEYRGTKEDIPEELADRMGAHIFGCDDCLDVCPYNLRAEPTSETAFHPLPISIAARLDELEKLDESAFGKLFRANPVRRARLQGFQRNLAIAKSNQ